MVRTPLPPDQPSICCLDPGALTLSMSRLSNTTSVSHSRVLDHCKCKNQWPHTVCGCVGPLQVQEYHTPCVCVLDRCTCKNQWPHTVTNINHLMSAHVCACSCVCTCLLPCMPSCLLACLLACKRVCTCVVPARVPVGQELLWQAITTEPCTLTLRFEHFHKYYSDQGQSRCLQAV